ncbi:hypothetical protein VZ95_08010 [Elstera litoralis]|uniref:Periplasmic heavy metal sensor n=1 Tax=Elstera litoralis TaxID=552518 RepID=A0A0F3ITU2_9PROT|nr:hypothetical protein VZ95_08010 [Elstera litoralis]
MVSVAGNLFLGGLLVGSELRRPPKPPFGPPEMMIEQLATRLSAADQAVLNGVMAEVRERFRTSRATIERAKAATADILAQEPLDLARLRQSVIEIDAQMQTVGKGITDSLVGSAEKLSPEGRAFVADLLRRPPPLPPR